MDIYERLGVDSEQITEAEVVLTQEQRDKGRLRTTASNGREVRIFLERGKPLQVGELLLSQCGTYLRVAGAEEPVTTARCDDWFIFSRACYHLGNRHVKLQIGDRWLRIPPDHVLEEMLVMMGLTLTHEMVVFVPESGAYTHGHHHH